MHSDATTVQAYLAELPDDRRHALEEVRRVVRVLNHAVASGEVVRLRLVGGKVTLVHRRLWPALVRLEARFGPARLAALEEEHTASGKHLSTTTPFPEWVPEEVVREAAALSEAEALAQVPECLRADP